jgi:hypothetical protein
MPEGDPHLTGHDGQHDDPFVHHVYRLRYAG